MRAHFTPQAEMDLEEVGDYIARARSYYGCFTVPETYPEFSAASDPLIAIRIAAEALLLPF